MGMTSEAETGILINRLIKIIYIECFIWLNPYHMNKYQNGADGWTGWGSKRDLWHQLKRKIHFSGGVSYYILIKDKHLFYLE